MAKRGRAAPALRWRDEKWWEKAAGRYGCLTCEHREGSSAATAEGPYGLSWSEQKPLPEGKLKLLISL